MNNIQICHEVSNSGNVCVLIFLTAMAGIIVLLKVPCCLFNFYRLLSKKNIVICLMVICNWSIKFPVLQGSQSWQMNFFEFKHVSMQKRLPTGTRNQAE